LAHIINADLCRLVLRRIVSIGGIVMVVSRIFIGGRRLSGWDGRGGILCVRFFAGFALGRGFICGAAAFISRAFLSFLAVL
jgi:hypothetical protein